jgi:copper homeostasis protein
MTPPLIEVCLDSTDSAAAAQAGGAARVELCDNLVEGGTTPSAGMIAATRRAIDIGLHVMIRPRGGDFCYGPSEVEAMLHDIGIARELGAEGVVFGALLPDGRIDEKLSSRLLEAARPLSVTFHRAFDMSRDPFEALDALKRIGVERLLSSGQKAHVLDGLDLLAELVLRTGEDPVVMPGCGVTPSNARRVVEVTRAREIHVVGTETAVIPMRHLNPDCYMGTEQRPPEYGRLVTTERAIREFVDAF